MTWSYPYIYGKPAPIAAMDDKDFMEVLDAIDHLNRHARAGGPKQAIYWLKREAIVECARRSRAEHRLVQVLAKCNRCAKGIYIDSWGEECGACRHCGGTSIARLKFVETRAAERYLWHTPQYDFWSRSIAVLEFEKGPWEDAGDWQPNQPGVKLAAPDLAWLLNIAEPALGAGLDRSTWDHRDGCHGDNFKYRLHLGDFRDACAFCGATGDLMGYGISRDFFDWTMAACPQCREGYERESGSRLTIFDAFPMPEVAQHPEVEAWRARHAEWKQKKNPANL